MINQILDSIWISQCAY